MYLNIFNSQRRKNNHFKGPYIPSLPLTNYHFPKCWVCKYMIRFSVVQLWLRTKWWFHSNSHLCYQILKDTCIHAGFLLRALLQFLLSDYPPSVFCLISSKYSFSIAKKKKTHTTYFKKKKTNHFIETCF